MSENTCSYCAVKVERTEGGLCLRCEWLQTVRNQTLEEIVSISNEELIIKQQLKEVIKRRKTAQKHYDNLWDEHMKIFFDKYPLK